MSEWNPRRYKLDFNRSSASMVWMSSVLDGEWVDYEVALKEIERQREEINRLQTRIKRMEALITEAGESQSDRLGQLLSLLEMKTEDWAED